MKKMDIFISYHRSDKKKAERIYNICKNDLEIPKIFFDQESLRGGDEWKKKIAERIHRATHFIIIVTEGTIESIKETSFYLYEIYLAIRKHEKNQHFKIIPIYVDTIQTKDKDKTKLLPIHILNDFNSVNFSSIKPDKKIFAELITPVESEFHSLALENYKGYEKEIEKYIDDKNIIICGPNRIGKSYFLKYLEKQHTSFCNIEYNGGEFTETHLNKIRKLKNTNKIILLDEFQTIMESPYFSYDLLNREKGYKFIAVVNDYKTFEDNLRKNNKHFKKFDDSFYCCYLTNWSDESVENSLIKLLKSEDEAKLATIMCGGQPEIISKFFDYLLLHHIYDVHQIIEKFLDRKEPVKNQFFINIFIGCNKQQQSMIKVISQLVDMSHYTEPFYILKPIQITKELKKICGNFKQNKLFKNRLLNDLEGKNLIGWKKNKKEIHISFGLFFLWVQKNKHLLKQKQYNAGLTDE